jgi:DNA invertase Pin-like site-specific DNA recombinase
LWSRNPNPEFLCFCLNSLASIHVEANTVGVALTHFNTKSVANMPIPLPPLAEQHRIVAKVDALAQRASRRGAGASRLSRTGGGGMTKRNALRSEHVEVTLNEMKRAAKPAPAADPARKQAVIYARVSSKEQEKEGFSIPAQLKLLKEYAATNGFSVAQEYIDVETAEQTGRAAFGEMIAYLKAHSSVCVMLVEKTDRLYRNLKDWVTVDELDVEMHFPKEGVVLARESRSSEKFMHGIKVLMAQNYIGNLSKEARKGMQDKVEQGVWPTKTPLGYRNITGPDGKKIILPDPALSPIVGRCSNGMRTPTFR